MQRRHRTSVVSIDLQVAATERSLDFIGLANYTNLPRPERPRQIRNEDSGYVKMGKTKPRVQLYYVAARRQIREMVALLCQKGASQSQTVGAVLLKNAPCAEIAELL